MYFLAPDISSILMELSTSSNKSCMSMSILSYLQSMPIRWNASFLQYFNRFIQFTLGVHLYFRPIEYGSSLVHSLHCKGLCSTWWSAIKRCITIKQDDLMCYTRCILFDGCPSCNGGHRVLHSTLHAKKCITEDPRFGLFYSKTIYNNKARK